MKNITKISFISGIVGVILIILLFIFALAKVITWMMFFILIIILIIVVSGGLFLYYYFLEKKKIIKEEQKELISEEICSKIAKDHIIKKYTDYIGNFIDEGTARFGADHTPIYKFIVQGEYAPGAVYIVLINRVSGDKRSKMLKLIDYPEKEVENIIKKIAEELSSKPREEAKPYITKVMTPEGRLLETEEYIENKKDKEKEEDTSLE